MFDRLLQKILCWPVMLFVPVAEFGDKMATVRAESEKYLPVLFRIVEESPIVELP